MKTEWKKPQMGEVRRRQIVEMKEWLGDCDWSNMSYEDFQDLSPVVVARGVSKHYDGGVIAFLDACPTAVC